MFYVHFASGKYLTNMLYVLRGASSPLSIKRYQWNKTEKLKGYHEKANPAPFLFNFLEMLLLLLLLLLLLSLLLMLKSYHE